MKTKFTIMLLLLSQMVGLAQKRPRFNPEHFESELQQFITTEACLTAQEAATFFPVYKEMRKKQRSLFIKGDQYRHVDYRDNELCAKAIRELDDIDLEIKTLQQTYYRKFLKLLPAGKVLKRRRAEEKFHRKAFWKAAGNQRQRTQKARQVAR